MTKHISNKRQAREQLFFLTLLNTFTPNPSQQVSLPQLQFQAKSSQLWGRWVEQVFRFLQFSFERVGFSAEEILVSGWLTSFSDLLECLVEAFFMFWGYETTRISHGLAATQRSTQLQPQLSLPRLKEACPRYWLEFARHCKVGVVDICYNQHSIGKYVTGFN